ncbi:MAG: 3-dehydroquinate synthase [Bacteroidales bacterium]|nr:3-dehydroquinate synthase [Bacteroidales bacterium]
MNTHHGTILYGGLSSLSTQLKKQEWENAQYTLLVDENTFQHCLPHIVGRVEAFEQANFIEVPVGEEAKTLEVASQIWLTLLEDNADKQHVIINIGGGSICDLGGFVASCYKRGIRYINIPTTLLAMVDAAIGGKTALDFGSVKNSIGQFYQPTLTVIEHSFLATLSPSETVNGVMEMVKTAIVTDPMLYAEIIATTSITKQQIQSVARNKSRIAKVDPYDQSVRHILNFGHTFGHAIEIVYKLPHGTSVGIGMLAALYLSTKKLSLPQTTYDTYYQWLTSNVSIPKFTLRDIEAMLALMHNDKKNQDSNIHCVLLQEVGAAVINIEVSDNEVRDALLFVAK